MIWTLLRSWATPALAAAALAASIGGATVQTVRLHTERLAHAETKLAHAEQAAIKQAEARAAMLAAGVESHRRVIEIKEIAYAAQTQLDRARADADAARTAGERLRQRVAALTAAGRCPATTDPTTATTGPAADATGAMLADVFGRMEEAGRAMAAHADASRAAGLACQQAYDALTVAR